MAKRQRWAIAFVFLSLCIFGYKQVEVAIASPQSSPPISSSSQDTDNIPNVLKIEKVSFQKEASVSTLDGFIENVIKTRKLKEINDKEGAVDKVIDKVDSLVSSVNNIPSINQNMLKDTQEPYTLLKTDLLLKKTDVFNNNSIELDNSSKLVKVKKMQNLASYIADTYNVPLTKAETIVYSTFVEANKKNLEPMLVLSLISIESRFDQYSKSSAGAVGLTQVMAKVHRVRIAENKVDIWSTHGNIKVGTDILKDYVQLAKGNMRRALQMYNGSSKDPNYSYSNKVMSKMKNFVVASNSETLAMK